MKKLLIAITIASTLPFTVKANANDTSTEGLDHCYFLADISGDIMGLRQMGVPMTEVMKAVTEGDEGGRLMRSVVQDAYDEPLWSTPENKQRAVTEFSNNLFHMCIKVKN